jgi:hypothetical protein
LDAADMQKIVRLQMNDVLARDGLRRRDVFVNVTESALQRVIRAGFDAQLGARAVRRMLEREIIGPLGDCLSSLKLDQPALVHIHGQTAQTSVACRVTPLQILPRSASKRISDLRRVVEIGEALLARLETHLVDLAGELQATDEQLGQTTHNTSYYGLREYLHRCNDLLKAGKARLSYHREPRLDLPAAPAARPRRDAERTGGRRFLLDWQAQEDLRSAVEDRSGDAWDNVSEPVLAGKIAGALTTATVLIDQALGTRSWLLGFTHLTAGSLDSHRESQLRRVGRDYEIYPQAGGTHDFLARLASCLRHSWQYELTTDDLPHDFWHVSGVAALGLLRPLLGTYRTQSPNKPEQLSVLRAIPVPLGTPASTWRDLIANDRLHDRQGRLLTPAEQPWPTDTIRGVIGEQVIDFASAAQFDLSTDDWFRSDKTMQRMTDWWTQCLPAPMQLLEQ